MSKHVIQKLGNLIITESFSLLNLRVEVRDIFEKEFMIETDIIDEFEQFLYYLCITFGVSVFPLAELASKI